MKMLVYATCNYDKRIIDAKNECDGGFMNIFLYKLYEQELYYTQHTVFLSAEDGIFSYFRMK